MIAVAIYLDLLIADKALEAVEQERKADSVHNDTEIYSYSQEVSQHTAEYHADAYSYKYLILCIIQVKLEEAEASRRRYYRMTNGKIQGIRAIE